MNIMRPADVVMTLVALIVLDMLWFSVSAPLIYTPMFGLINGQSGYLQVASALVSWTLIAILLTLFAESESSALVLGLLCYGIYNATNHATIRGWTLTTSVADTLWGGLVCMSAYAITRRVRSILHNII